MSTTGSVITDAEHFFPYWYRAWRTSHSGEGRSPEAEDHRGFRDPPDARETGDDPEE